LQAIINQAKDLAAQIMHASDISDFYSADSTGINSKFKALKQAVNDFKTQYGSLPEYATMANSLDECCFGNNVDGNSLMGLCVKQGLQLFGFMKDFIKQIKDDTVAEIQKGTDPILKTRY